MSRRNEIDRKKALRDAISGRKKEKAKPKKQKEIDADLNDDGKVDEEDLSLAHKAYNEAKKKAKKIVKKDR